MNNYAAQQPSTASFLIVAVIELAIAVIAIAGVWKTFAKAGKPGWAAIVPFYNVIVMLEIGGKPLWWLALLFVPFVNIAMMFMIPIAVAKAFGKGTGYGIGLALLGFIFFPILGFGSAQYVGTPSGTGLRRAA
jgi:Family of unknown function (DUF5684)